MIELFGNELVTIEFEPIIQLFPIVAPSQQLHNCHL